MFLSFFSFFVLFFDKKMKTTSQSRLLMEFYEFEIFQQKKEKKELTTCEIQDFGLLQNQAKGKDDREQC